MTKWKQPAKGAKLSQIPLGRNKTGPSPEIIKMSSRGGILWQRDPFADKIVVILGSRLFTGPRSRHHPG